MDATGSAGQGSIKVLLSTVWKEQVQGSGTIVVLMEYGQDMGGGTEAFWVEFGSTQFAEVRRNLCEVARMVERVDDYGDNQEQFIWDLTAIVDDLAYHAAIITVYCFSIEQTFRVDFESAEVDSGSCSRIPGITHDTAALRGIAASWQSKAGLAERERMLVALVSAGGLALEDFDEFASPESLTNRSLGYLRLRRFMRSLLSVQSAWAAIKACMN
jgi:hypothetical protein